MLIGIRGEPTPEGMERILKALKRLEGVAEVQATGPAQVLVAYGPQSLTVMDLILVLNDGVIEKLGPPAEVLARLGQPGVVAGQIQPKSS